MERIKLSDLKKAIGETRKECENPIDRDALDRLKRSVLYCPPQFLRITKMYDVVMKIKKQSKQPSDTKLDILQNFQETTIAGV
jgi:hypothetical protein